MSAMETPVLDRAQEKRSDGGQGKRCSENDEDMQPLTALFGALLADYLLSAIFVRAAGIVHFRSALAISKAIAAPAPMPPKNQSAGASTRPDTGREGALRTATPGTAWGSALRPAAKTGGSAKVLARRIVDMGFGGSFGAVGLRV